MLYIFSNYPRGLLRVRLLGMVPHDSEEEAAIEEHLLWCHHCLRRAEESDSYVDLIRAGIIAGEFELEFR